MSRRVPVERPAALRKLPRGHVPVRLTHAAANCILSHNAGWHALPAKLARTWSRFCREWCTPRAVHTEDGADPYTRHDKRAMRALADQIDAALRRTTP